MADEEQKRIFSKNLNKFLSQSQKTQKEVAEAINVSPQTFNTWCQGIALPRMGKVQKLADYFGILKSDLIDDKEDSDLTSRDKRDIAKDLDRIMAEIKNGDDGPLYYNGTEIDDASINLLENAIEFALTQAKKKTRLSTIPIKTKSR